MFQMHKIQETWSTHYVIHLELKQDFQTPVSTCESKSDAIWTGLACLSAMTRTSDGPAGMSIETIASLFCWENKKRTNSDENR